MQAFTVTTNHYEHKLLVFSASEKKYARSQAEAFIKQWMPGCKVKSIRKARDDDRIKAGYTVEELPFEGCNGTKYEGILDHAKENEIEYNDERQKNDGVPNDIKLDADEYGEILYRHCNWSKGFDAICEDYAQSFSIAATDWLSFPGSDVFCLEAASHSVNHDTIFTHVHPLVKQWVMARAMITGFGDATDEDGCPVDDDFEAMIKHILVDAGGKSGDWGDFKWRVYEVLDQDSMYFENHVVDWPKVEAACAEAIDEKAHKYDDDNGNPRRRDVIQPRCVQTLDMFA